MEAFVLFLTGTLAAGIIARHIYRSVKIVNGCYKCEGCAGCASICEQAEDLAGNTGTLTSLPPP